MQNGVQRMCTNCPNYISSGILKFTSAFDRQHFFLVIYQFMYFTYYFKFGYT